MGKIDNMNTKILILALPNTFFFLSPDSSTVFLGRKVYCKNIYFGSYGDFNSEPKSDVISPQPRI